MNFSYPELPSIGVMMKLHEQLAAVGDESSFLEFVRALLADRKVANENPVDMPGHKENGWACHTIETFLEGALAWAESTNVGASQGLDDASPWKRFATFLYCGKIYE